MGERRSRQLRMLPALGVGVLASLAGVAASALNQDRPRGRTETCVTADCHVGIVTREILHGPVAQQKCEACHVEEDPAEHRFAIVGDPAKLCTTCHSLPARTFEHAPVRNGDCTGCHDPHGSDHAAMLVADPTEGLCLACHREDQEAQREFVHGPVAAGACILCHESHSSWQPVLLTEPARDLCLGCHSEIAPDPLRDRYRHEPVEEDCLACHDAHASDVRFGLHENAPGLCYRCHEATREAMSTAVTVHGALVQEGGCLTCHGAHYAPLPALQRREEVDLCLDCHDEPLEGSGGTSLTDMAALLAENPEHHGPIREGSCTACHLPHAATEANLLRKAYPPDFYAPYEPERYALCFECHLVEMVRSREGEGLTRFRDGDLNLHWLHVNREKGRTCRACHEVHASKNPFHMRDSVPFGRGGWALEIRFKAEASGGSCTPGCHVKETYQRAAAGATPEPSNAAAPKESQP